MRNNVKVFATLLLVCSAIYLVLGAGTGAIFGVVWNSTPPESRHRSMLAEISDLSSQAPDDTASPPLRDGASTSRIEPAAGAGQQAPNRPAIPGSREKAIPAAEFLTVLGSVALILSLLGVAGVLVGIGLFRLTSWSRIAGLVLSVINLPLVPIGTAIGVYGLIVLPNADAVALFRSRGAPSD